MIKTLSTEQKSYVNINWFFIALLLLTTALIAVFAPTIIIFPVGIILFVYFWYHKDKLVIFLMIYMPFEEIILKMLPDNFYVPSRYIWEVFLHLTMFLILMEKILLTHNWKKSPIDILILIFMVNWFISAFINDISVFYAVVHIKNIIRYIPLFYIVYNLKPDRYLIQSFMKILIIIAIFQSIICIGQAVEGDWFVKIFQHKEVIANGKEIINYNYDKGYYQFRFIGTLGANINLGNYLSFALIFLIAGLIIKNNKLAYLSGALLITGALILSSSRISLISAYFALNFMLFKTHSRYRYTFLVIPVALLVMGSLVISLEGNNVYNHFQIFGRILHLFSSDYMETVTTFNRGYIILYVLPKILLNTPLFGVGPGTFILLSNDLFNDVTFTKAAAMGLDPTALRYVRDIGYSAMIVQTGLIGLTVLGMIFIKAYKSASKVYREISEPTMKVFMLGSMGFIISLIVKNLAVFTYIYRVQSLLTWVICGMVFLFAQEYLPQIQPQKCKNMKV